LKWFEEQARKGAPKAQNYWARHLEESASKNITTAIHLYQQAAQNGQRSAENRLADLEQVHLLEALNIETLKGSEKKHKEPALKELTLSPEELFQIGKRYESGQDVEKSYEKAWEHYIKAAEKNHPVAQYSVGVFYDNGYHVQCDHQEAMEWYKKAAHQGCVDAQLKLGDAYCCSWGGKHYKEAIQWYRKAASLLNKPEDLKRFDEILEWYGKAESENDAEAYYQIGRFFGKGSMMVENIEESMKWHKKAAELGHPRAREICKIELGASIALAPVLVYSQTIGSPKN